VTLPLSGALPCARLSFSGQHRCANERYSILKAARILTFRNSVCAQHAIRRTKANTYKKPRAAADRFRKVTCQDKSCAGSLLMLQQRFATNRGRRRGVVRFGITPRRMFVAEHPNVPLRQRFPAAMEASHKSATIVPVYTSP
jgi:hypothetical protein